MIMFTNSTTSARRVVLCMSGDAGVVQRQTRKSGGEKPVPVFGPAALRQATLHDMLKQGRGKQLSKGQCCGAENCLWQWKYWNVSKLWVCRIWRTEEEEDGGNGGVTGIKRAVQEASLTR